MSAPIRIRLGTRGSLLARWQADWVAARLRDLGVEVEMVLLTTSGDLSTEGPIGALGDRGVFTKEIQRALRDARIDLAVHSLKDLPTDPTPGLVLAAVPERAPAGDALVSRRFDSLDALPGGAVVGTGSMRRRAQLLCARPDLHVRDVRGNVDTRLRKLDRGDYDALVLAEAGLRRLGLHAHITQVLPPSVCLPAVGQGALGLETRDDNPAAQTLVARLDHPPSRAAVTAERSMLAALGGGCLAPIAAWGRLEDVQLTLTGRVLPPDGSAKLEATCRAPLGEAESLGRRVAETLLAQGAKEYLDAARHVG